MSQEILNPAYPNLCQHCNQVEAQRQQQMKELYQRYDEERKKLADPNLLQSLDQLNQRYQDQRQQQMKELYQRYDEESLDQLNQRYQDQRQQQMKELYQRYDEERKKLADPNLLQSLDQLNQRYQDQRSNCQLCKTVKQEIDKRDLTIDELKKQNAELRCEADINKKILEDFKERMSIEASAEIGCSSETFEDINNPCRESELRKRYDMFTINKWPKCLQKIKENKKRGETADEKKEKETVQRMIKNVFEKASIDMKKKKDLMDSIFKISDSAKSVINKKQSRCMDMAVQNLQMMILYDTFTHYQDINKELGHSLPDYLCELADDWYKQACLMALHNPPLTLDWNNKEKNCGSPFPPMK